MAEFINTADVIGDDEMCDQIIMRTVTEYKENRITTVGQCAFYKCAQLVEVDLPEVTTFGQNAFYMCGALKSVKAIKLAKTTSNTFQHCESLERVSFPALVAVSGSDFGQNTSLKSADFSVVKSISAYAFAQSGSLNVLILRSNTVCTLANANALGNTPIARGTGYIYVPRALLSDTDATKDYRRATNWATYAAQFRALEDYTVDGTVTGELDETKIVA